MKKLRNLVLLGLLVILSTSSYGHARFLPQRGGQRAQPVPTQDMLKTVQPGSQDSERRVGERQQARS
jgi:hypothetical protein